MSTFFRLIKSEWGRPLLANGDANSKFASLIEGDDVIEGYDIPQEELKRLNELGYNIYWFPNHPSTNVYESGARFLNGKHIDVFNFVFVDMDLKDKVYASKEEFLEKVSEFPLPPTLTVDSGNGIHVYWNVTDLTRDAYVATQVALMEHFKTDDSVYTVLQLMRCPGSLNTKRYQDYVLASVVESHTFRTSYKESDFADLTSKLDERQLVKVQNHLNKLDGKLKINLPEYVNVDELPDKFVDLMYEVGNSNVYELFTDPKGFHGDRSSADMKLAHTLKKAGFNRKETLGVIANTQKALEKGGNRLAYAELTVDKVYMDKLVQKFKTAGQMIRTGAHEKELGDPINGTDYFDYGVLGNVWRKKEILGLIAGSGMGKTSVTLKMIKDAIENNSHNDDIYVFFSLEMTEASIIERWIKLVGKDSPLADRLYVIGTEHPNGDPRNIGLQEIYEDVTELKNMTGKNVGIVAIDHIGIISRHIDLRKKFTFNIDSEAKSGFGNIRTLSLNSIATQLRPLVKMLDTFLIILTQTTKMKGQGDKPIEKDGAYGMSDYENIVDRIITIWQPLMRVQDQCPIRFLAWQYVKIREKHQDDGIQTYEKKLLTYNLKSGDLKITTHQEYQTFLQYYPLALEERDKMEKGKSTGYSIQITNQKVNNANVAKVQSNQHS